ncbi:histidine biosynthesis protein [Thiomicrospira aerophila AL3]|uniref:Histidine biosynthesis protein n=1 Tax=Thiomicrospira aerophila AL3 TaxID=717772 RepID=W0DXV8_9GAMM|nr:H-NS histone family protein [Thiomicrospira aerophila]AHF01819.1 histidine biosynthesis protein [Thiomicrospira aerophila AL3]
MNLDQMSVEELIRLEKQVQKMIEQKQQAEKKQLIDEFKARAASLGLSIDLVINDEKPAKKTGAKVAPKYQHPSNPSLTWTGRGRTPKWVEEQISAGRSLTSLEI